VGVEYADSDRDGIRQFLLPEGEADVVEVVVFEGVAVVWGEGRSMFVRFGGRFLSGGGNQKDQPRNLRSTDRQTTYVHDERVRALVAIELTFFGIVVAADIGRLWIFPPWSLVL
jgi:hypothetical protein